MLSLEKRKKQAVEGGEGVCEEEGDNVGGGSEK